MQVHSNYIHNLFIELLGENVIMGNYVNKFFSHNTEAYNNKMEKEEIRCLSSTDEVTPEKDIMETPPIVRKTLIDPRSITSGIDRTPIEVILTRVNIYFHKLCNNTQYIKFVIFIGELYTTWNK